MGVAGNVIQVFCEGVWEEDLLEESKPVDESKPVEKYKLLKKVNQSIKAGQARRMILLRS